MEKPAFGADGIAFVWIFSWEARLVKDGVAEM